MTDTQLKPGMRIRSAEAELKRLQGWRAVADQLAEALEAVLDHERCCCGGLQVADRAVAEAESALRARLALQDLDQ
jgi:hypothetical protein